MAEKIEGASQQIASWPQVPDSDVNPFCAPPNRCIWKPNCELVGLCVLAARLTRLR